MSEVCKSGNGVEEVRIEPFDTRGQLNNSDAASPVSAADIAGDASNASKTLEVISPEVITKKTPSKRTPSKRMSFIERAQKESEELVRNMGGSLELDGGRRTRSSARGTPSRATPATTPPPTKKSRTSPCVKQNSSATTMTNSTPSRSRGRGRKIDISTVETTDDTTESKSDKNSNESISTSEIKGEEEHNKKQSEIEIVETESKSKAIETKVIEDEVTSEADINECQNLDKKVENQTNDIEKETDAQVETSEEKDQNNLLNNKIENKQIDEHIDSPMETVAEDPEVNTRIEDAQVKQIKETKTPVEENISATSTLATSKKMCNTDAELVETVAAPNIENIDKKSIPVSMDIDANIKNVDNGEETEGKSSCLVESVLSAPEKVESNESDANALIDLPSPSSSKEENSPLEKSDNNISRNSPVATTQISDKETSDHAVEPIDSEDSDKQIKPSIETTDNAVNAIDDETVPQVNTNAVSMNEETSKVQETIVTTNTTNNKPDNDFCEPKIVSPTTISTNSSEDSTSQLH